MPLSRPVNLPASTCDIPARRKPGVARPPQSGSGQERLSSRDRIPVPLADSKPAATPFRKSPHRETRVRSARVNIPSSSDCGQRRVDVGDCSRARARLQSFFLRPIQNVNRSLGGWTYHGRSAQTATGCQRRPTCGLAPAGRGGQCGTPPSDRRRRSPEDRPTCRRAPRQDRGRAARRRLRSRALWVCPGRAQRRPARERSPPDDAAAVLPLDAEDDDR